MDLCEFSCQQKFRLLYKASTDGFSSKSFHNKCDGYKSTITIILSTKGYIFGGYTDEDWSGHNIYKTDKNAFIFSLVNKEKNPIKIKCNDPQYAICCDSSYGPIFGGFDLAIFSNSNVNKSSYSYLCDVYKHPFYTYGSTKAKSLLAGTSNFRTVEIEVYCKEK